MKEIEVRKEYGTNENTIINTLKDTVGRTTISIGKHKPKECENIKQLRTIKKEKRKAFEKSCTNNINKSENLNSYIQAQINLKTAISEEQKNTTEAKIKQMIQEGGTKSNSFWKTRRKLLNTKQRDQYDTITEEGTHIECPQKSKEYIANYFENLYQARRGEEDYKTWTETIQTTIKETEKNLNTIEQQPITNEEVKQAIKSLKRNKSTGPDDIPNEIFINATEKTINKYREMINTVHKNQAIPNQWQKGEIITFYKGKGTKGKCSSERGITLASNFGKLYERIINNRIKEKISISDAQAGGKKGMATRDHIRTLTDLITIGKEGNKTVYVTYLDVTKAYDKAWLDAILYVLTKQGLNDPTWLAVKNLNQNLTANIQTKYGPTREIQIQDSIRQGGVLSVIMYATLMDEIGKEIKKHNLGIQLPQTDEKLGCLLWMDDVALIANTQQQMQDMLNITQEISNRYRIKFGEEKTKTITIKGRKGKATPTNFKLGNMEIGATTKYKYLGMTTNAQCNLKDHITSIIPKVEGAYQTIMMLAHDSNFDGIQMELIWKLIDSCIIPIITYSAEVWDLNKQETKQINQILDSLLKRILKTPTTTPREALYIETGLLDPKTIIDTKRIMMDGATKRNPTTINNMLDKSENKKAWKRTTEKIIQEYGLEENQTKNKTAYKRETWKKIKETFKNRTNEQSENK